MTPNYFESNAFSLIEMVKAISRRKHKPMQAGSLGIFRTRGAMSTKIAVEERGSAVTLIQTSERAAPAEQYTAPKRTVRLTKIPHIKKHSFITADELRELRQFGSETAQASLESMRDDHLQDLGDSVDVTHEHLLMGALRGVLLDADNTELLNTFTFFGVTQEAEVAFDLSSSTEGAVTKKVRSTVRTMLNNLGDDAPLVDHIHAFCSPEFMDDLITSKDFRESVKHDPVASAALREGRVFRSVLWQDVVWEEYRLGDSGLGGTWVATDKCILFPVGPAIYDLHFAPGRSFSQLDAPGLPMYSRTVRDLEEDAWIKLMVESNPLPICTRPKALMKGKRGS